MHRDDVCVTFDQDAAILLRNGPFGLIKAVKDVAFVVDFRFGRVEVFRYLLVGAHRTAAECDDTTADAVDREDHACAEPVVISSVFAFDGQSGGGEELLFVALFERLPCEGVTAAGAVTESEGKDRSVGKAAFAEIGDADVLPLRCFMQCFGEIFGGIGRDDHHAFAVVVAALFLGGELPFRHLDAVLFRHVFERFGVGHVFVLHHEGDGVAAFPAAETFEKAFRRRDNKRRCLFVMERTACLVIDPFLFELHEIADYLDDICRGENAVYCLFIDHGASLRIQRYVFFRYTRRGIAGAGSGKNRMRCGSVNYGNNRRGNVGLDCKLEGG